MVIQTIHRGNGGCIDRPRWNWSSGCQCKGCIPGVITAMVSLKRGLNLVQTGKMGWHLQDWVNSFNDTLPGCHWCYRRLDQNIEVFFLSLYTIAFDFFGLPLPLPLPFFLPSFSLPGGPAIPDVSLTTSLKCIFRYRAMVFIGDFFSPT